MQLASRSFLAGACSLLLLSGCGSSSYGTSSGTVASNTSGSGTTSGNPTGDPVAVAPKPTGTNNAVNATASIAGTLSVTVGAVQTVSITFTSSDGSPISGFGVAGALGALPAGWSGPGSFTCASVSTGSGCVLNLAYAPAAAGSGTLTLDYVFVDNATMPSTGGSVTIDYAATMPNNAVALASPTGEIDSVIGGGNQPVSVSFTSDDGNAVTQLSVTTDLSALPPGWSSSASGFSCSIISKDNGCQLPLTYAPTASARGVLTLDYSFIDNSGTMRTGALNIPYATAAQNTVVADATPSGEVNAVRKANGQAVAVSFTTNDGKPASRLYVTSDLAALPAGWSSASRGFSCASVGSGNGCQLHLTYAPSALATGTLILDYAYTNSSGMAETGSMNVGYAATTNDSVVATPSPVGPINVIAPAGRAVAVTFTTDDGLPATGLQLTSSLLALPAGWSSPATSFACIEVTNGNACQLSLTYAPMLAGNGMLMLNYTYMNNAGVKKSGSVAIAYRATTDDNIVATPNPASLTVVSGSGSTPVTVTFTTDDSAPAAGLTVTSGLNPLPAGWSGPGSFACAAVSTGTSCQLNMTYAPVAVDSGTLSLTYGYSDDAGNPKTGTLTIPYAATP